METHRPLSTSIILHLSVDYPDPDTHGMADLKRESMDIPKFTLKAYHRGSVHLFYVWLLKTQGLSRPKMCDWEVKGISPSLASCAYCQSLVAELVPVAHL